MFNLLSDLPARSDKEVVDELLSAPHLRIERIVSAGQASPPGFWYDQPWAEWVLVLSGAATLVIEGEFAPRAMIAGDSLLIPAHQRHRVDWTDPARATVWLAVHFDPPSDKTNL